MFKKSQPSTSPTLFGAVSQHVGEKKLKQLENPQAWQNVFYQEITSRVEEAIFSPLYSADNGRPNAPIRQLVGMLILKEGNDWTDEQLFEACTYNILVLRALGLTNLYDEAPCGATYYNFKESLLVHEQQTGENLLDKAFSIMTKGQVIRYKVSGHNVRMDSKLLHSNVAKTTRLQMAIGVITKFYKSLKEDQQSKLNEDQLALLDTIVKKTPEQYTYQLNKQTAAERLALFGNLLHQLVVLYEDQTSEEYKLIVRLWNDHFELLKSDDDSEEFPHPKNMKGKGGATLQSAHDPDATYRNKPGAKQQIITGFVSNIVDTCSLKQDSDGDESHSPKLNLITAAQTEAATTSDDKFFIPAIEQTRAVLEDDIVNALTDGAYNSQSNEQMSRKADQAFNWFPTALQGIETDYDFELLEDGNYKVTDRRTGVVQISKTTPKGKIRILQHHGKAKYHYFEKATIINYFRRKAIENYPQWVQGLRANGEATIHQVFCKLNGMKTKYRGLFKHHCYVLARCFWVNFKRINAYLA